MAMKSSWALWQRVKKRLGLPADTDISTDIANISTLIGTPTDTDVSTDIASIQTDTTALVARSKRCEFEQFTDTSTSTSFETVLSITGSGVLYDVSGVITGAANLAILINIDGKIYQPTPANITTETWLKPIVGGVLGYLASDSTHYALNWEFQDNLLIQIATTDGGETASIWTHYGHD